MCEYCDMRLFVLITPSSQEMEPPTNPGRFTYPNDCYVPEAEVNLGILNVC